MYMNIGIFLWMIILTAYSFDTDQNRVIEINEFNHSKDNQEDAKIYFEAIKDTFELYTLDKKYKDGKVCLSDQTYLDIGNKMTIYANLKRNFDKSCSYIIGNVVIAHISHENISFLDSILEISGYLFIFNNTAKTISLRNLQIIRGENILLFNRTKFAVLIANNYYKSKHLELIVMPNLQVILQHDILIVENPGLCYIKIINWNSLTAKGQSIIIFQKDKTLCLRNFNKTERRPCHSNCPKWSRKQYCWSNKSSDCQKINDCRTQLCSNYSKCYINNKKEESCCSEQCAGGCSGPRNSQCLACKNFNNDGSCVAYCPRLLIYKNNKKVKNPNGKLAFHHVCVNKCPVKFFNEYGNCVVNCTKPNTYPINETCIECPIGGCPKVCLQKDVIIKRNVNFLNRHMLDRLENCTVYDGNIIINSLSFEGDLFYNMSKRDYGIRMDDLKKLSKLEEIYGYLNVNTGNSSIQSLLFLKTLKIIRANNIRSNKNFGLSIIGNHNLFFLGLKNLVEVQNGKIYIKHNMKLCWTNTLTKNSIKYSGTMVITKNKHCERGCHEQCDKEYGCWGPSEMLCIRCSNYIFKRKRCVSNCTKIPGFFNGNDSLTEKNEKQCVQCHFQCLEVESTCSGPRNDQCNHGCKAYSLLKTCVSKCPPNYFANSSICIQCHHLCIATTGNIIKESCTGTHSYLGIGGCRKCNNVILTSLKSNSLKCFNGSRSCPSKFFRFLVDLQNFKFIETLPIYLQKNENILKILNKWFYNETQRIGFGSICLPCHPLCSKCNDGSNYECPICKFYKLQDKCLKQCPLEYFSKKEDNNTLCSQCHEECDGSCFGSSEYHCLKCRHVKIFTNEYTKEFFCNYTCGSLHQIIEKSEIICVEKWKAEQLHYSWTQIGFIIFAVCIVIFCGLILVICFIDTIRKKRKYDKKHIITDDYFCNQSETLLNIQPNMATLLLITESQLCRGNIIGSGAFGVVYKAVWEPNLDKMDKKDSFLTKNLTKDNSIKLHVAVKVLTDISDSTNIQLLEEAKVMASVDHLCCLRILGVCLTAHPQLITQFMPLGCLLEFCQKNRSLINNITFLNWAKQIAYGMEYLELKGIIHCDLAARNVLVQSPKQVKITDFGLAKMLDQSEHQYQSKGGRMPIKWLAVECIKYRVFSFKSDVWSYGVTLWEMFTYGEKPFQNVKAFEVLNYLETGQRLSQPKICSIDVYSIMVQCWLVDAELRPTFSELSKAFELMVKNPDRYLLIQNSLETESIYSHLENDAINYDEFLQALISAPQLNPDYESLDENINDKKNIKYIKNRYRKMCSFKNFFLNYINDNSTFSTAETEEIYDQSLNMWYDYSRGSSRLSSSTLITTVNTPIDLSDDGYLLSNGKVNPKTKLLLSKHLPISECEENVFTFPEIADQEVFEGQESIL